MLLEQFVAQVKGFAVLSVRLWLAARSKQQGAAFGVLARQPLCPGGAGATRRCDDVQLARSRS